LKAIFYLAQNGKTSFTHCPNLASTTGHGRRHRRFRHRHFVDVLPEEFVGAILMLAQALDVDVVAEGVETPEQLAYLKGVGCSAFQGYLFGRPGDVSAFL